MVSEETRNRNITWFCYTFHVAILPSLLWFVCTSCGPRQHIYSSVTVGNHFLEHVYLFFFVLGQCIAKYKFKHFSALAKHLIIDHLSKINTNKRVQSAECWCLNVFWMLSRDRGYHGDIWLFARKVS